MVEPAWMHLKIETTKKGALKSRAEAAVVWSQAWKDCNQQRLQGWIERIPIHIQRAIELEGGTEYIEGRPKNQRVDSIVIGNPGIDLGII